MHFDTPPKHLTMEEECAKLKKKLAEEARKRRRYEYAPMPKPTACTAEHCDRPVHGRGLCAKHHQRARRARLRAQKENSE